MFSIAAPVTVFTYYLVTVASGVAMLLFTRAILVTSIGSFIFVNLLYVLAIAVPPLLAFARRLRWPAIAAAAIPAIYFGYHAIQTFVIFRAIPHGYSNLLWYSIFFVLEVVVLAISPGQDEAPRS